MEKLRWACPWDLDLGSESDRQVPSQMEIAVICPAGSSNSDCYSWAIPGSKSLVPLYVQCSCWLRACLAVSVFWDDWERWGSLEEEVVVEWGDNRRCKIGVVGRLATCGLTLGLRQGRLPDRLWQEDLPDLCLSLKRRTSSSSDLGRRRRADLLVAFWKGGGHEKVDFCQEAAHPAQAKSRTSSDLCLHSIGGRTISIAGCVTVTEMRHPTP